MNRRNRAILAGLMIFVATAFGARGDGAAPAPPPLPVSRQRPARELPPLPPRDWGDAVRGVFDRFPGVDRERVMRFLTEEFPQEVREFKEMAKGELGRSMDYMNDLVRESLDMLETQERNPALFKELLRKRRLEREALELAEGVGRAKGDQRQQQIEQLRGSLGQAFELKQDLMRKEVERLGHQLQELRDLIEKREASRGAIIEHRIGELLGESETLTW